jgi:hypothetical protein
VGDVIEAVDGRPATPLEVVVASIAGHKSGESVQLDLRRDSNRRTINATLKPLPGRSERFFREFASIDVAAAWAKANTRVQVLQGEYDDAPYTNLGKEIVAIVDKSSRGTATFTQLAGLDHCWSRHASLEASIDKCGQGQPTTALGDAILAFLRSVK